MVYFVIIKVVTEDNYLVLTYNGNAVMETSTDKIHEKISFGYLVSLLGEVKGKKDALVHNMQFTPSVVGFLTVGHAIEVIFGDQDRDLVEVEVSVPGVMGKVTGIPIDADVGGALWDGGEVIDLAGNIG